MENLINFITGGAETFTPAVMVGLIVFVLICDGLFMVISNILGGGRK